MSSTSQSSVETNPPVPPISVASRPIGITLSLIGLILGLLALGFAGIPSVAMERALPFPFETPKEAQRRVEGPPLRKGGVTLRVKGFSINFFGKDIKNEAAPANPNGPAREAPILTADPIRWFLIAAWVFALVGLAVSSMAYVRERHPVLNMTGMGCSVLAITWQFVVIGIILGVAVAIILFLLYHFFL